MPLIRFTAHLARYADASEMIVAGNSVATVLAAVFTQRPILRSYVLDDQGGLRKHVSAFVDGEQIRDRRTLTDVVRADSTLDLIQALSGG